MEKKDNTFFKSTLTYGAIIGFCLVIYEMVLYLAGINLYNPNSSSKFLGYVSLLILFTGLFISFKNYRDKVSGGIISYGRILGLGAVISVFTGIITAFYMVVLFKFIAPEIPQYICDVMEQGMIDAKMQQSMINESMAIYRKHIVTITLFSSVINMTFLGFIFSLIAGIFLKKAGDPFNDAMKDIK